MEELFVLVHEFRHFFDELLTISGPKERVPGQVETRQSSVLFQDREKIPKNAGLYITP